MKALRRLVITGAAVYSLCFLFWRLLIASPLYDKWWPLQLSEVFAVWALLPLPFLLAGVLYWHRRWLAVLMLIPLLWFGSEYGSLFVPEMSARARASADKTSIRVMTFNTWKQYDETGDFAAAVDEWQPDFIALQEVSSRFLIDLDELSGSWPYQVQMTIRGTTRVAFLSKLPILSYEADNQRRGCHCLQLLLDWHGQVVRVIVVHIRAPDLGALNGQRRPIMIRTFDTGVQRSSFEALLPHVEASQEPLIVLGDFNTTERQAGYKLLTDAGLKNAHAEAGWGLGLTYPAPFTRLSWLPFSVIRIDHIFYDEAWQAMRTWNAPLMGSDHRALLADLNWVDGE